jgi:hypothetical protein
MILCNAHHRQKVVLAGTYLCLHIIPSLLGGRLGQRSPLSDILRSSYTLVEVPAKFLFEKEVFENMFWENILHRKVGFSFLNHFLKIPAQRGFRKCFTKAFVKAFPF